MTSVIAVYCEKAESLLIKVEGKVDYFPENKRPQALVIEAHRWNKQTINLQPEYCSKMSRRIYDDLTDIYQSYPEGKKGPKEWVPGC